MNLWPFGKKKEAINLVSQPSNNSLQVASTPVNEKTALAISAVWASVNLLAGTISTLPLMVYRTDKNGNREVARDHPLFSILHDSPNAEQTPVEFWEALVIALEQRGNGFALKQFIGSRLVGLKSIFANVSVTRNAQGQLIYRWTEDGKSYVETSDKVLHLRGFGGNPLGGISALSAVRPVFGLSQAINVSAEKLFSNGMAPSGAFSFERWLEPEQREIVEDKISEKYFGSINFGRPLVLEGGTTWQPFTINPEDMQMLQSRSWQLEEIARIYGVPPHMIGHTEKQTSWGTGVTAQTQGFQKFTLNRRTVRIASTLKKQLLTPADIAQGIEIEFNLEGLLRGSPSERADFYEKMSRIGAMEANRIRRLENWPPIEGGDIPRVQMQYIPINIGVDNANQNS